MNKKVLTYLLLALIVGIWGKIIHRFFFDTMDDSEAQISVNDASEIQKPDTAIVYAPLNLDYEDPFLKKARSTTSVKSGRAGNSMTASKGQRIEQKEIMLTKPWPKVEYRGLIKNKGAVEKKLGIVMIDQQSKLMSEQDVFAGVKLIDLTKDSIKVSFNDEESVFIRE